MLFLVLSSVQTIQISIAINASNLATSTGVLLFHLLAIKCRQMYQLSKQLQSRFKTSKQHLQHPPSQQIRNKVFSFYFFSLFATFRRQNVRSLILLTNFSNIFGRLFFYSLLITFPCNAVILMLLALVPMTPPLIFVLSSFAILQLVVIFFFHYQIAFLSDLFHRPVKSFLGHFVVTQDVNIFARTRKLGIKGSNTTNTCLREQLKMVFYIEAFHTLKLYSVVYGKWGNITVNSFKKVINKIIKQSKQLLTKYLHFLLANFLLHQANHLCV